MNDLEFQAERLRTKIRVCLRKDYFLDAEKFQVELELLNQKIKGEGEIPNENFEL